MTWGKLTMRKLLVVFASLVLLVGCAEEPANQPSSSGGGGDGKDPCAAKSLPTVAKGKLTVGTDRPAFEPWFKGSPKDYSGYEGEVASEVAKRLELPIKWVVEPFNKAFAPGPKDWDFDINQITITEERERAVDFSDGYFENNQGVLALEDSQVAKAKSISDLKGYQFGAQVGTTSLAFINSIIQPSAETKVFDTTNDAVSALQNNQIDALVTDVVTTVYLRDFVVKKSVVLGQYPKTEQFGMVFEEDSPLVECVNGALEEMKSDGTLEKLEQKFLQQYLEVPTLE
jgi:polar amino acid transport system substrate-binding protein